MSSGAESASRRAFARIASLSIRFRWPVLLVVLVTTGYMVHQLRTRLLVDNSNEAFLDAQSDAALELERLRDAFGRDDLVLILIEGEVFSMRYLERLRRLHRRLAALDLPIKSLGERKADRDRRRRMFRSGRGDAETLAAEAREAERGMREAEYDWDSEAGGASWGDDGDWDNEQGGSVIDQIVSLVNARQTRAGGGGLRVEGLLDDFPQPSELPALRARVLSDPSLVNQLVGKAGRHSIIVLRTAFMSEQDSARVYFEIERIARAHCADGFHVAVSGMPAVLGALNRMMADDMRSIAVLESLVLLALMFVVFRHPLGVLGPVLVVVQAAVWTLGSMAALSVPMTIVSSMLSAFIQVVGIGDSVHVLSVYRDSRARGVANHQAIVHAVSTTGAPVLYTTLTTAVGLLSFRFASLQAIRDMGTFGALGVCYALLLTVVLLPVLLSFNNKSLLGASPGRAGPAAPDLLDRFLAACDRLSAATRRDGSHSARPRRLTLLATAVLAVACLFGTSLLAFHHDPLTMFPRDHSVRRASRVMSQHVGGSSDLSLIVDTKPGETLRDRELMLALQEVERHVMHYRDAQGELGVVGSANSVLDVLRESWRALHDDDPAYYRIPDSERGVSDMLTLFEGASPDELRRLATIDLETTRMTFRVRWMAAEDYGPLARHALRGAERFIGDRAEVSLTGSAYTAFTVVERLLSDLLSSFGTALIVITVIMILLLRDLKLGLISMLPNLAPIAVVTGLMGYSGIPVDLNNLLFASIAISIAVDDTIHFLHQFRVRYLATGDTDDAIAYALSHAGRAMVSTSFLLIGGFLVMLTGTLNSSHMFAILVSTSVAVALLADLIVAPALLRTFYPRRVGRAPRATVPS